MIVSDETPSPKEVRTRALRFLARREHSEEELVKKLISRGASHTTAEDVVRELKNQDLVNDERFAEAFVQVRVRKGYGPNKLKNELRQRGVSSEVINRCCDFGNEFWREQINKVVKQKYKDIPPDSYSEWAKRARFLEYRGFASYQVREALGKFTAPE